MMTYREVKEAMTTLLFDNSADRFTVIGRQLQNKSSKELRDNLVQVYYSDGQFPENLWRPRGNKSHNMNIEIDLSTSAAAKGDLTTIKSQTSTPEQKAAAILAIKDASYVADNQLDDLIEIVFGIICDARNYDIGLEYGIVSSPRVDRIQKDTVLENGGLVVKTANIKFVCRVSESVSGSIGNKPDTVVIDQTVNVNSDKTPVGVTVENDNT